MHTPYIPAQPALAHLRIVIFVLLITLVQGAFAADPPQRAERLDPAVEAQARQAVEAMQKALPVAPRPQEQAGSVNANAAPSTAGALPATSSKAVVREVEGASRHFVAASDDGVRSTAPVLPSRVRMYAGQAKVYRVPRPLRRVAIGNGEILTAINVGKDELVLIATAQGDTTMHLWLSDGSQRELDIAVVGANVESLSHTVGQLLADIRGISITPVGSNVIVSGTNLTEAAMNRIALIQKAYPQVLNFGSLDPVGMRPMITMDVRVVEVDKNALDKLGIEWSPSANGPSFGTIADWHTNPIYRVIPKGNTTFEEIKDKLPTSLSSPQSYFGIATTILSSINYLMSNGKAWMLASPRLSARSGSSATFLAGGEVPIPMPGAFGQMNVTFKEYGIKLNMTPKVNDRLEISTSVLAEVSRIDPSVTVLGVPGFLTRRTESELNVRDGQTMVIAGLIGTEASKDVQKIPLLGDIPVIGRLFRSDGFKAKKTELVVLVTPHVDGPETPETRDGVRRANEIEQDMMNEANGRQKRSLR